MSLLEQVLQAPAEVKDQVLKALIAELPSKGLSLPKLSDAEIARIRNAPDDVSQYKTFDELIASLPDDE
jgi:hypothetical protein